MTTSHLEKHSVLVLNKNWQAINVTSPLEALSMMFSDSATGLDCKGEDMLVPLKWNDWIKLEITDKDECVSTVRGKIKCPVIIILSKFDKVPLKRPRFSTKNLWIRDRAICQYTGQKLTPKTGNIDHVIPKSRGGKTDWSNCVLSHKDINSIKANKTPREAGLALISPPKIPSALPSSFYIENKFDIKEWNLFLDK
jgi:hypothetical protein